MEKPTPFDLNAALKTWRENLGQSPRLRPENLEELESHLRDSVERLRTTGLTEEEAFVIAIHRLGGASPLETEFSKVNRKELWWDRSLWMLAGVLLSRLLWSVCRLVGAGALVAGATSGVLPLPEYGASLSTAVLYSAFQLLLFITAAWVCLKLIRQKEGGFKMFTDWLVRYRARTVLAVVVISLVFMGIQTLVAFENIFIMKLSPPTTAYAANFAGNIAVSIASPVETIGMISATFFLVRRRAQHTLAA